MATKLIKAISRVSVTTLDGSFGIDRNRHLVLTLVPGKRHEHGTDVDELIELRPSRTRRPESITWKAVYRYAIRARVNREQLEKARARKEKKAGQRLSARIQRADKRLRRPLK